MRLRSLSPAREKPGSSGSHRTCSNQGSCKVHNLSRRITCQGLSKRRTRFHFPRTHSCFTHSNDLSSSSNQVLWLVVLLPENSAPGARYRLYFFLRNKKFQHLTQLVVSTIRHLCAHFPSSRRIMSRPVHSLSLIGYCNLLQPKHVLSGSGLLSSSFLLVISLVISLDICLFMAVCSVNSTCFSLGVEALVGVCFMNSCMALCCSWFPVLLFHVSSLMAWFMRTLLFRPLLLIVYVSPQNSGKSLLRLALPQHMPFVTPSLSKARMTCPFWISFSSTSSSPACFNRTLLLNSSTSPICLLWVCMVPPWHVEFTISAFSCCFLLQPLRHAFCNFHFAT